MTLEQCLVKLEEEAKKIRLTCKDFDPTNVGIQGWIGNAEGIEYAVAEIRAVLDRSPLQVFPVEE